MYHMIEAGIGLGHALRLNALGQGNSRQSA
jgi:hypothetical protein